ncbi:MAG: hypothetical protein HQK52_07965 [Oligoflexia bacterium]|nr:hypothetical protein [Oligoflexia bacterium]
MLDLILSARNLNAISADLIAGGPCVCFAKGNPLRLQLQDLVDCLIPAMVASIFNKPLMLYIQTYESDLMKDVMSFDPTSADYKTMIEYLKNGINALLTKTGHSLPKIIIADTGNGQFKSIVNEISLSLKNCIEESELYGLYGIEKSSDYPYGTIEKDQMIEVYYRNISLYHPLFFQQIIGEEKKVLLVENLTQQRAINLVIKKTMATNIQSVHYLPAPNRQGKEMCMGNRNHKIELRSTELQIKSRAVPSHESKELFNNYYRSLFGDLSISEVMKLWKQSNQLLA